MTAAQFRTLARSSPQRWRTIRFTASWSGRPADEVDVRAWIRRPGALRVERLADAALLQATIDQDPHDAYDPMYNTAHWVAMLSPVELADGQDDEPGTYRADVASTHIPDVVEVNHHGREAWQADLRPTEAYSPLCSCCPLLPSQISDDCHVAEGGPQRNLEPGFRYAEAHRVRLDVATGICVYSEELGGTHAGTGHDLRIEAVDEPVPDDTFCSCGATWVLCEDDDIDVSAADPAPTALPPFPCPVHRRVDLSLGSHPPRPRPLDAE